MGLVAGVLGFVVAFWMFSDGVKDRQRLQSDLEHIIRSRKIKSAKKLPTTNENEHTLDTIKD
jgi:hypothetical protein